MLRIVKGRKGKGPKFRETNPINFHEAKKISRDDCISTWYRRKALPTAKWMDWKESIRTE